MRRLVHLGIFAAIFLSLVQFSVQAAPQEPRQNQQLQQEGSVPAFENLDHFVPQSQEQPKSTFEFAWQNLQAFGAWAKGFLTLHYRLIVVALLLATFLVPVAQRQLGKCG
ncbi:hypothetical protein GC197_09330 [bacterium]|nr:hypothetical protein [bacterium]